MIKAGIIGGAGYTAGELVRLLLNHPEVSLEWVHSSSNAGRPLCEVHSGIAGDTDMLFADTHPLQGIDVLFLCSGHGASASFWQQNEMPRGLRVIDLAQDFRDESCGYVYGLPEINRPRIAEARKVANPGCFATAIQLALLPLAASGSLEGRVHTTGITGSTGAGVKPSVTTHFSWRDNNLSVYKPFTHQHLTEIGATLRHLQPAWSEGISFIPVRGDFPRGIFCATTLRTALDTGELTRMYSDFYSESPFTHVCPTDVDLKQVVNTNKCLLSVTSRNGEALVISVIDNLLKGASGQAVENMNLMFGLPEDCGLRLKASAF